MEQIRAASDSAAYPPSAENRSSTRPYLVTAASRAAAVGQLGHLDVHLLQFRDQDVQPAGGQHPVLGGDVQVALPRILRQIARSPVRLTVPA